MPTCDFCKIIFPHAEPNVATHEGIHHRGWVNLCAGHKGRVANPEPLYEEAK